MKRWDFTAETLLSYSKMFPGAKLVLSTWSGDTIGSKWRGMLVEAGILVVKSSIPDYPGHSNFNLQLVSTRAGLEALGELGVQFALKQRTDQRIYSADALSYLATLLRLCPGADGLPRVFSSSLNSFLARPFGLSDMLQFSSFEEVSRYWDHSLATGPHLVPLEGKDNFNESFLAYSYALRRAGSPQKPDWHGSLRDFFGIVDHSTLDMLWPKYSRREFLWRRYVNDELQELSHAQWVGTYL